MRAIHKLLLVAIATTPLATAMEIYSFEFEGNEQIYVLEVDLHNPNLAFLEYTDGELKLLHHPHWRTILISQDKGDTWSSHPIPMPPAGPGGVIEGLFTTSTGAWIVKTRNNTGIWRLSPSDGQWSHVNPDSLPWLGSWSIDEHEGVLMYAEYGNNTPRMKVWRSTNDGQTWEVVLEKRASSDANPEVNHFHVLQVDPYTGHWWLSSGDFTNLCRVWISADHGETWLDVTDPVAPNKWHRATHIEFTPTQVWWGTDDHQADHPEGQGARLVSSPKGGKLSLMDHGKLALNEIRSAIKFDEIGYLLITEHVIRSNNRSPQAVGIELVLVTPDFEIIPIQDDAGNGLPIWGYFTGSHAGARASGTLTTGLTSFAYARGAALGRLAKFSLTAFGRVATTQRPGGVISAYPQGIVPYGQEVEVRITPDPGYLFHGVHALTEDGGLGKTVVNQASPTRNEVVVNLKVNRNLNLVPVFVHESEVELPVFSTVGWVSLVMFILLIAGFSWFSVKWRRAPDASGKP